MSKLLLVVDMQNDFVGGVLGNADAVKIVPDVVAKVKEYIAAGEYVICTQDIHSAGTYKDSIEGKLLPEHAMEGSYGARLVDGLEGLDYAKLLRFHKSVFGGLDLPDTIRSTVGDLTEIEIIGVCTDICVVSNALILRSAFPELPVRVYASCCAGVTPESHTAALQVMRSCLIELID
jgi:nicotinamidase-related amidase